MRYFNHMVVRFCRDGFANPPLLGVILLLVLLAACTDAAPTDDPTPRGPTLPPPLPASPTVNPVAPIVEGPGVGAPAGNAPGVSNPTQAGLAAEGQLDQDLPTLTPQPTLAQLPMMIGAADGLVLQATFFGPAVRPAPGVLLVHDRGQTRVVWDDLASRLQAAGYAVLTIDLRGYGETGGAIHWSLAVGDVGAALTQLAELPGINPAQLIVIGAGMGANLALNACADQPGCAGAVLISPGLDYRGVTTVEAMARLGLRPVLIVTSENDNNNPADSVTLDSLAAGPHQLIIYPVAGHGMDLFAAQPGLSDQIVNWLRGRVAPPARPEPD